MWTFYLIALIPIIIGAILWVRNKEIVWQEWLAGSVIALIMACTWNYFAVKGMTDDVQTFSGQITYAMHYPAWQEYYEEAIYRTEYYTTTESYTYYTGSGKSRRSHRGTRTVRKSRRVFDHWEPRTRWHSEHWTAYSNIDTSYDIDGGHYNRLSGLFKDNSPVEGRRRTGEHNSKMIAGDPNDYRASNKTGWIEPVTKIGTWENKIKAAPSVFSFAKVPTNAPVFDWPKNNNPWVSDRILGTAKKYVNQYEWDKLNADLGPKKQVNLIIVGFDSNDSTLGQYQQAKWIGGKKNDLVITYGGDGKAPVWAFSFGWTESELCKRNIETYLMRNGIDSGFYAFLRDEIIKNYKIKDWHKFDYIRVEPPTSAYVWFIIVLALVQTGLWVFFHKNEIDKEQRFGRRGW